MAPVDHPVHRGVLPLNETSGIIRNPNLKVLAAVSGTLGYNSQRFFKIQSDQLKSILPKLLIIFLFAGCSAIEEGRVKPPLVYRVDIQQGNVVNQAMLNKLRVGMDERQVKFIMGTPLLVDPFHPERWDYLYYVNRSGEDPEKRHVTLYFDEQQLSHLGGDVKVSYLPVKEGEDRTEKSIVVPEKYGERGWLENVINDRPEIQEKTEQKEIEHIDEVSKPDDIDILATETLEIDKHVNESEEKHITSENKKTEDEGPGFFSKMWDEIIGK